MKANLLILIRYRDETTSQTQVYETSEAAEAAKLKIEQSFRGAHGIVVNIVMTSGAA